MRKVLSLALAVLMALGFGAVAFADSLCNPDLPRVADYADCFTDEEEENLAQKIAAVTEAYGKDIVIYTDIDAHGKSIEAGAEDFYDENGYGYGENKSGTILYICFDPDVRSWYTSACGDSISYIDYDTINIIDDAMEAMMVNAEFYDAVCMHIDCLDELYANGKLYNEDSHQVYTGDGEYRNYQDEDSGWTTSDEPVWKMLLAALFFGLCTGLAVGAAAKKKAIASMTTIGIAGRADDYTIPGSFRLSRAENIFLTMTVSRVAKAQNNNNGGGGMHSGGSSFTGGHISSGGSFHSGGGGRHF